MRLPFKLVRNRRKCKDSTPRTCSNCANSSTQVHGPFGAKGGRVECSSKRLSRPVIVDPFVDRPSGKCPGWRAQ